MPLECVFCLDGFFLFASLVSFFIMQIGWRMVSKYLRNSPQSPLRSICAYVLFSYVSDSIISIIVVVVGAYGVCV